MIKAALAVLVFLLLGCAAQSDTPMPERMRPGLYPNYRILAQGNVYGATRDKDQAQCFGDFLMASVAPADMAKLDQYARGEIPLSATDYARIDSEVTARFRSKPGNEALRPYCPDKVDGFRLPN